MLYWLHLSRRDLVRQSPQSDGAARGAFSLRTPVRPNPIGTQLVPLVGVEGATVSVRGLDCLDGTPLLDLKPDRCAFTPLAPEQPGDRQVGDGPREPRSLIPRSGEEGLGGAPLAQGWAKSSASLSRVFEVGRPPHP